MDMNNLQIVEVNHGIANNFGSYIEVNKNLKNYPNLYNPIMKHELSHTDKMFSLHDFKIDFLSDSKVNSLELLKFMFKHPKSFTQLLPFYWIKKKGFVFDLNLLIMYLITFCVFIGIIYIGGGI